MVCNVMEVILKYTTGYAGTGKSTALLEQVKTIPTDTSVVIAPTHKALARLEAQLPDGLEIKTIHSLLGWVPTINEEATHIAHISATTRLDKELPEYTHIIIDEAGMMSEDMLLEITSKLDMIEPDEKKVYMHLYLDPYQLLPVKGVQIQVDPYNTTNLTTQHRAESIDIVNLYTKFVTYLQEPHEDLSTPYSDNVVPLDISKFKRGDRLLAYTNEAVGSWNRRIANILGVDSYLNQEVQLGAKLDLVYVHEIVEHMSIIGLVELFKEGKLKLQNSQMKAQWLEENLLRVMKMCDYFIIDNYANVYPVIEGINNYYLLDRRTKEAALENKSKFVDVYTLGRIWSMDYSFASTVHKAQGSEFDTVFVDKANMQKAIFGGSYKNYARLMYVALSRAKIKIYI